MLEAASKTCFTGSESDVRHLGLHWEDNFWMIFGIELDGGKAWRRRLPEALEGGYEHGVEGSGIEAFLEVRKRKKGLARGCFTTLFDERR